MTKAMREGETSFLDALRTDSVQLAIECTRIRGEAMTKRILAAAKKVRVVRVVLCLCLHMSKA